jgi:hypothetical protein
MVLSRPLLYLVLSTWFACEMTLLQTIFYFINVFRLLWTCTYACIFIYQIIHTNNMINKKQLLEIKEKEQKIKHCELKQAEDENKRIIIINNVLLNDQFKLNHPPNLSVCILNKEEKNKQVLKKIEQKMNISPDTPAMKEIKLSMINKKISKKNK